LRHTTATLLKDLGAPGGWGLVAWEQTLGELLSAAGYGCAVYGK